VVLHVWAAGLGVLFPQFVDQFKGCHRVTAFSSPRPVAADAVRTLRASATRSDSRHVFEAGWPCCFMFGALPAGIHALARSPRTARDFLPCSDGVPWLAVDKPLPLRPWCRAKTALVRKPPSAAVALCVLRILGACA